MRKNCVFEIKVDFKVEIHELPWNHGCFQNMTELFVKVDFNFAWFKVKTFRTSQERLRGHTTNTIFVWNFLMVESENNIFQSSFLEKQRSLWISWGYWYFPLNERAEFLVILGLQKPVLYTGNCMSTSTRHVTLKSPLLLQFPNFELGDNDNRQSNYTLMFCAVQKPYFPVLANLQSNKPQEKETLRLSHQHFAYMPFFKREIYHPYRKSRNLFTFLNFLDRSSCITSYKMKVYLHKWPLRARIAWQV